MNDTVNWLELTRRETREVADLNRIAILTVLRELGCQHYEATFSGSGDSGQIDDATLSDQDGVVMPMPDRTVAITDTRRVRINDPILEGDRTVREMTLQQALEQLVYDAIEITNPGWENNDGAEGTVSLDVETGILSVNIRVFYTESETYEYEYGGPKEPPAEPVGFS